MPSPRATARRSPTSRGRGAGGGRGPSISRSVRRWGSGSTRSSQVARGSTLRARPSSPWRAWTRQASHSASVAGRRASSARRLAARMAGPLRSNWSVTRSTWPLSAAAWSPRAAVQSACCSGRVGRPTSKATVGRRDTRVRSREARRSGPPASSTNRRTSVIAASEGATSSASRRSAAPLRADSRVHSRTSASNSAAPLGITPAGIRRSPSPTRAHAAAATSRFPLGSAPLSWMAGRTGSRFRAHTSTTASATASCDGTSSPPASG